MTRPLRWALLLAAALALVVLAARFHAARSPAQAMAPARAAPAIELAEADVAVARRAELTRTLETSGSLKAVSSAVVKARVAAEAEQVSVREGDTVRRGQLLVRLDGTEYRWRLRQAEEQARTARAQVDIARRTLDNNQALVEQGYISKNALDTSASNLAAANASLQAANAAAELARKALRDTEIRAPIDGAVAARLVQPGERVPVDAKLLEIVDLSRLELEAALPAEDVAALAIGSRARLQVDGLAEEPVTARVARINPGTQAGTRAVMTYLAVDPHPALRQGLFARGTIELQRAETLVVPLSAVRVDQARPYVLAVADGAVVQREVELGRRGRASFGTAGERGAESAVEVLHGVSDGDRLLRATAGGLREGTPVRLPAPAPAGAASASAAR